MKAKRIFFLILTGLLLWMGFSIWRCSYQEQERKNNYRFEDVAIDNPGPENIKVILDEDTLSLPPHSLINEFGLFKKPHRLRAFNAKGESICDTSFNFRKYANVLINPTAGTYVFWKIRYSGRPDRDLQPDSTYMQAHLIDSVIVFGNLSKTRALVIIEESLRPYKMDLTPDRKVDEKFQVSLPENAATYFIREKDFATVYRNINPGGRRSKLSTALHNLSSEFYQAIRLDDNDVRSNQKFYGIVKLVGGAMPGAYIETWKKDRETFRKFSPGLYDEIMALNKKYDEAPKEMEKPMPEKFKPVTLIGYAYYMDGFLKTKYIPFKRYVQDKKGTRYYKPDGTEEIPTPGSEGWNWKLRGGVYEQD